MRLLDAEGNPTPNQAVLTGTTVGLFCVRTSFDSQPLPDLHPLILILIDRRMYRRNGFKLGP
jgi:hypothetical protein